MLLKDDSVIKEYLLRPDQRTSLLAAHGASVHCIGGVDALESLLAGRCFVCLHYKLGPHGALEACLRDDRQQASTDQNRDVNWYVLDFARLHTFVDKQDCKTSPLLYVPVLQAWAICSIGSMPVR